MELRAVAYPGWLSAMPLNRGAATITLRWRFCRWLRQGRAALFRCGRLLWGVALDGQQRAGVEGGGSLLRADTPGSTPPRVVVSRSHTPDWVGRFCQHVGAEPPFPCGSAGYKTARILMGEADIYVHKIGLKEWDTCAPETVARALDWTVCKLRGEEHRYNQPNPKNHEFVVCRPAWKERVVTALAKSGALES